jgi:hypothetical protein
LMDLFTLPAASVRSEQAVNHPGSCFLRDHAAQLMGYNARRGEGEVCLSQRVGLALRSTWRWPFSVFAVGNRLRRRPARR